MGDGAGNVGQWRMALGPECQAEQLDLDPEGLEKKDRIGGRYVKDCTVVQLRGEKGVGQGGGEARDAPPK